MPNLGGSAWAVGPRPLRTKSSLQLTAAPAEAAPIAQEEIGPFGKLTPSSFIDRAKRPFISILYDKFISAMTKCIDDDECLKFCAAADRTNPGPRFSASGAAWSCWHCSLWFR